MTTTGHAYFASHVERSEESERLRNLQLAFDPLTIRRLEAVGVAPGWRCLEVGAGQGSMASWMADRVGPAGRVVAADIDLRLLGHLEGLPNVEVRECDICVGGIEQESFDLAHSRFVLMHLADPELALRRMVASLRPGGWILIEDPVFYEAITLTPRHPAAESYLRVVNVWRLCAEDTMQLNFGRKILRSVAKLGLEDFEAETAQRFHRGGQPGARALKLSMDIFRDAMLATGRVSADDLAVVAAASEDPTFVGGIPILCGAWARKPEDWHLPE